MGLPCCRFVVAIPNKCANGVGKNTGNFRFGPSSLRQRGRTPCIIYCSLGGSCLEPLFNISMLSFYACIRFVSCSVF